MSKETPTSNSAPRASTCVSFHQRLSPHAGAWERVANFPATPFSHQERPAPTSFSSPLVPLLEACICTFSSILCPTAILFWVFLIFLDTQRHLQDFESCFASSRSCISFFRSLIVVISYFLVSMATKGSIFSPILVASAVITLGKLVAYPYCTQASKSVSIAFVAHTNNASACLSHSYGT